MSDNGIVLFLLMSIVAGVVLMVAAMNNRRKIREMEHRERLAMIERGAVPPPETNPAAFEAAVGFADDSNVSADTSDRYRTAGVLMADAIPPRPPASETATAICGVLAPAIGACRMGCSMPNRSSRRRSCHFMGDSIVSRET